MTIHVLFGAGDTEQSVAQISLCDLYRIPYSFATFRGARVSPSTAYQADGVDFGGSADVPNLVVLFECHPAYVIDSSPATGPVDLKTVVADHHRPGDPGYGRTPDEFLQASSIGQLVAVLAENFVLNPRADTDMVPARTNFLLRDDDYWIATAGARLSARYWKVPSEVVLAAAADHCLHAAYRGECPGVDPDELMIWRAEKRAEFQQRHAVDSLMADIESARAALRSCPRGEIPHFEEFIPELPEAAARDGRPFTATVKDQDGRIKVVLQGADARTIEMWLREKKDAGFECYGDPVRGFAGYYR